MLKWLHQTFALTVEDVRGNYNEVVLVAVEYGHLEVLKWLHQTFELNVLTDDIDVFPDAVFYGHLDVLKWMEATFKLTDILKLSESNDQEETLAHAFRNAAENGHLEVLQWLTHTFKFKKKDVLIRDNDCEDFEGILANNYNAFQCAVGRQRLEVLSG